MTRINKLFWGLAAAISTLVQFCTVANAVDINLTWRTVEDTDLAGYKVYYGYDSRRYNRVKMVMAPDTSVTLHGLLKGRIYYFAVTAYDTVGNESRYSNELEELIEWSTTGASSDSIPPGTPLLLPLEIIIPIN